MKPPPAESIWERDVQNIWGTSEFNRMHYSLVTVIGPHPGWNLCNLTVWVRRKRSKTVFLYILSPPTPLTPFPKDLAAGSGWWFIKTMMQNHPQSSQVSQKCWEIMAAKRNTQPLVSHSAPEPGFCSAPRNRCAPSRTCIGRQMFRHAFKHLQVIPRPTWGITCLAQGAPQKERPQNYRAQRHLSSHKWCPPTLQIKQESARNGAGFIFFLFFMAQLTSWKIPLGNQKWQ